MDKMISVYHVISVCVCNCNDRVTGELHVPQVSHLLLLLVIPFSSITDTVADMRWG